MHIRKSYPKMDERKSWNSIHGRSLSNKIRILGKPPLMAVELCMPVPAPQRYIERSGENCVRDYVKH